MKTITTAIANAIIVATKKGDFIIPCNICEVTVGDDETPMTVGDGTAVKIAREQIRKGGKFRIVQHINDYNELTGWGDIEI